MTARPTNLARSEGTHQTKKAVNPFPLEARGQCQDECAKEVGVAADNATTTSHLNFHGRYSWLCSSFMATTVMPVART
jgi:hypothetical protein